MCGCTLSRTTNLNRTDRYRTDDGKWRPNLPFSGTPSEFTADSAQVVCNSLAGGASDVLQACCGSWASTRRFWSRKESFYELLTYSVFRPGVRTCKGKRAHLRGPGINMTSLSSRPGGFLPQRLPLLRDTPKNGMGSRTRSVNVRLVWGNHGYAMATLAPDGCVARSGNPGLSITYNGLHLAPVTPKQCSNSLAANGTVRRYTPPSSMKTLCR